MTEIETITRLVLILDAAIPALEKAAKAEAKREAGKPMLQITERQRAETAMELVAEVCQEYGIQI